MSDFFQTAGEILLYLIGFFGVVGLIISIQDLKISTLKERFKLTKKLKMDSQTQYWLKHDLLKKYHFLLSSIKWYEIEYFTRVIYSQLAVFLLFMILVYPILQNFGYVLLVGVLFIYIMPIAFLYIHHKQLSNELQDVVIDNSVILLQEYGKNHQNMLYALKEVVNRVDGRSKIAYAKLFARMHGDAETKELAAERFAYQLGRIRGKNLAIIILRACKDGVDVTTQLETLVEDLVEFNKKVRTSLADSRETAFMGYVIFPLLIGLYVFNEMTLIKGNTFHFQFQTEKGLNSFLIACFFGLVNIGLAIIVKRPKKM